MIAYLASKTRFRTELLKERGRLAHSYKITAMNHIEQTFSFST